MHQTMLPVRSLPRAIPRTTCLRLSSSSAFSTSSRHLLLLKPSHAQPKRAAQCAQLTQRTRQPAQKRYNSSAPAVDAAAAASKPGPEPLTWNRFLALRKQRRRISLVGSIICAGAGAGIGITVLSTSDFDLMQFGIDPTFVIGGAFIGSALLGWLVGPFFGTAVFNMRYRALRGQIAQVRLAG
jgi:import inner membrane translocase subunit TIM23